MKQTAKVLVLILALVFSAVVGTAVAGVDTTPPVVEHTAVSKAYSNANLILTAKVSDTSVLQRVTVYFRTKGTTSYYAMNMNAVAGEFRAAIPASYMLPGSIEYYIETVDAAGNMATWPAIAAAKKPQIVRVMPDTTSPETELMFPEAGTSSTNLMVVILVDDKANNVDPATIQIALDGENITAQAEINSNRAVLQVPKDSIHTRSVIEVAVADFAGNKTVRRFTIWEEVDWTRELRIDVTQSKAVSASLDTTISWGPLTLQAKVRSNDSIFTKQPGQPESKYSFNYDARYLQLGLGDINSQQSALAMSSLQHRGADLTLKLGPLVMQGVYGYPQLYVPGKDYARKAIGGRFAFDTGFLDLAANVVKIKDQWTEALDAKMPGVNPELNYVVDAQAGVAMFNEKLALQLETAASLYFENAKGDLWPLIDSLKADYDNQADMMKTLIDMADKVPVSFRQFLELPNPPLPFKLDAGAQASLRVPLPWSNLKLSGFHFGPDYYTIAGSGDRNVDGMQATFATNRWFNLMQFSADYQWRLDNAMSLLGYLRQVKQGDRNLTESYNAKVSLGPAGRLNLDLTGTYREKGPQFTANPDTITQGATAAVRNLRFNLLGMGVRLGGTYSDIDELHPANASADKSTVTYHADTGLDIGGMSLDAGYGVKEERDAAGAVQVINPSATGSVTLTLQQPKILFIRLNEIRLKASATQSWTAEQAGGRSDVQTALKGELDTKLTQDLRLGAAWKGTQKENAQYDTTLSGSLRWQF